MEILEKYALKIPDILLPKKEIPLLQWAVIACDQYTQDKAYWQKVSAAVHKNPSTLHMILPEVYLDEFSETEKQTYINNIHRTMKTYLADGVFAPPVHAAVYTERTSAYGRMRKGLVCCIDLEQYDWKTCSMAKIRATEETIEERIPARIAIRSGASLETPHIMLLVNDPKHMFVEAVGSIAKTGKIPAQAENTGCVKTPEHALPPLYDTDLMLGVGHITGWSLCSTEAQKAAACALERIAAANTAADGSVFLFAVGDGNHSLATAKAVWNEYKKCFGGIEQADGSIGINESIKDSPLRYALVEIVNLYDEGLVFEPIHRVLFNTDADALADFVRRKLDGTLIPCSDKNELVRRVASSASAFGFVSQKSGFVCLEAKLERLAVSALQSVLDDFIKQAQCTQPIGAAQSGESSVPHKRRVEIDYIHGTDEVFRLAKQADTVSILMPHIAKERFFATVAQYGSLPRKSFSMGEASEKRFYLECRSLA